MKKEQLDELCRGFTDQGKLIEAGFVSLRYTVMPPDAPLLQITEMRMAFFAGAQHLFASIMGILEPGAEPTEKDMARLTSIQAELDAFIEQFKVQHGLGEEES
jgi:hypothetical protein